MNNLFNTTDVTAMIGRIDQLSANSQKQWGKMNVAQMMAHCNVAMETASGKNVLKPVFILGRMIGSLMKKGVLSGKPFAKNSPTDKSYIFPDTLKFEEERTKLKNSLQKFCEGGESQCTKHPHPFFGHFTPQEWALFQWKHIDHHLRQFGV